MSAHSEYVVREAGRAEWDQIVRGLPCRTVFHTMPWLETIAAAIPKVRIIALVAERPRAAGAGVGGEIVAAWPALALRKGPFRVLGSPLPGWSTAYMGPLFALDCNRATALEALLAHPRFRRHAYFACRTMDSAADSGGAGAVDLAPFGFTAIDRFDTYLIDLTRSEEELWDRLKGECRTRIRKAQKLGIEVRREEDDSFIDDFWAMSLETFAKSKIQPTHTREFCAELFGRLPPSQSLGPSISQSLSPSVPQPLASLHVISAFVAGRRAATLMLPCDDRTMYYWGGASFQEYRELPVNNLLHWQAICDGRAMGLQRYDLVSTRGGPGRFKKTFGPDEAVVATHWERSPSRLMAALKRRYEGYLRQRRRVEA